MSYKKVLVERDGALTIVTLNDAASLNAVGEQMRRELVSAVNGALDDVDVRAILLTGAGRAFCTGAHLKEMASQQSQGVTPDVGTILRDDLNPLLVRLKEGNKPVVAAVNGAAAGFGCGLALAADVVLVGRSGYFVQSFIRLGVIPDGGSSWMLPRLAGRGRAMAMMMLGDRIGAQQAIDWGLALRCVEDADLMVEARALASHLASGPTQAYARLKHLLGNSDASDYAAQMNLEATFQEKSFATEDCREGISAFVERRQPNFRGK